MSKKIVAMFSLGLLFVANESLAVCNKPSKPVCATNDEVYSNQKAYKVCQTEIEAFHGISMKYIDCLKAELEVAARETQSKVDMISDEANAVIKEFNCRSGMEEDC